MSYKKFDQYFLNTQEVLGNGVYGKVYKGFYDINDEYSEKRDVILAIKETRLPQGYGKEQQQQKTNAAVREIESLGKLSHPNIIKFIDAKKTENNIYLIMEYCNQGDLAHLLKRKYSKGIMSEMEVLTYFREIIDAFRYLISKDFVHRDIKPENILVHNDQLKLADFGFCRVFGNNDVMKTITGTPLFQDPNIQNSNNEGYTSKSDIFSLGILLWHMLYYDINNTRNSYPWYAESPVQLVQQMQSIPIHFPDRRKVSDSTKELITRMVQIDQNKRISWQELFEHPKLQSKIDKSIKNENNDTKIQINVKNFDIINDDKDQFKSYTDCTQKVTDMEKIRQEARLCQQRLDFEYQITLLLFNTATKFFQCLLPLLPNFPQGLQHQLNYVLYKRQFLKSQKLYKVVNELNNSFNVPSANWLAYISDAKTVEQNKQYYKKNYEICQINFKQFYKYANEFFQGKNEHIRDDFHLDINYADSVVQDTLIYFLPQLLQIQQKLEGNIDLSEFDIVLLNVADNLLMIYTQETTLQYDYKKQQNFEKFFDQRKVTPKKKLFIRILKAYKSLKLI